MKLIYADAEHKKKGWTLSYELLKEIQKEIEKNQLDYETPDLEQIESVLLAFKELT